MLPEEEAGDGCRAPQVRGESMEPAPPCHRFRVQSVVSNHGWKDRQLHSCKRVKSILLNSFQAHFRKEDNPTGIMKRPMVGFLMGPVWIGGKTIVMNSSIPPKKGVFFFPLSWGGEKG